MQFGILKSSVLNLLRWGFKVPECHFDRYNELTHLKELLNILDINCILDVGANRGQFATEIRKIGYQGHLISFEPVRSEFNALSKSFQNDTKWKGYQIALGSEEKTTQINIHELTVMSSLLKPVDGKSDIEQQVVEVKRLDTMFQSLIEGIDHPRVFLKIDTQGYDLEVFKGARNCIDKILGLQSELSVQPLYKGTPHYIEALNVYEKEGFNLYNLSVVNRVPSGGLLELNAFMHR